MPPDLPELGREVVAGCLAAVTERLALTGADTHVLVVDGACGNGHDTVFLAGLLRRLHPPHGWSVLSFDVQPAALEAAADLVRGHGLEQQPDRAEERLRVPCGVRFLLQGHEHLGRVLAEEAAGRPEKTVLAAAMFNLGFLPRSDKRIITRAPTTLAALTQAAGALVPGGVLAVHAYGGHAGGREELEAVTAWCEALPFAAWSVTRYCLCNKPRNPESLFLAVRRGHSYDKSGQGVPDAGLLS